MSLAKPFPWKITLPIHLILAALTLQPPALSATARSKALCPKSLAALQSVQARLTSERSRFSDNHPMIQELQERERILRNKLKHCISRNRRLL